MKATATKITASVTEKAMKAQLKDAVERLMELKAAKDLIEKEADELRNDLKEDMEKLGVDEVAADSGRARLITRRATNWSLEAVKEALGAKWVKFAKADEKKIKAAMETGMLAADEAASLTRGMDVTETTVLEVR